MRLKLQLTGFLFSLFILNASLCAQSNNKKDKQVIITANLKSTDFNSVPVDRLVTDFLDRENQQFDYSSYDSLNGNFKAAFHLSEPRLMLFFLKEVFVTPGDSINVTYRVLDNNPSSYKDTLIVTGDNEKNYQYYTIFRNEYLAEKKNFPKLRSPVTEDEILRYRTELSAYFEKLKPDFITSLEGGLYTKAYKKFVFNDLYNYWLNRYLLVFSDSEAIKLSASETAEFKQRLIANSDTNSSLFLSSLLKLHRTVIKIKNYDLKEFKELKSDALKYPTYLKDYLLTADIISFSKNKRGFDAELMTTLYEACESIVSEKYRQKLLIYKASLTIPLENLSIKLDTIKLIDINDNITSFGKVISNNVNNVTYIDFWASWCIPCRAQTDPLKSFHKSNDHKDLKYIQISLDTDAGNWKKAVLADGVNFSDQYRFINDKDSWKFNLDPQGIEIPFYLIINKSGQIVISNAPRPGDPILGDLLFKYME